MLFATLSAASGGPPSATFIEELLDGASLYGMSGFGYGRLHLAETAFYSEGLIGAYGGGAPIWGDWDMFSEGAVGIAFDLQWDLTSASSPTTYSVTDGALPDGLALENVSGNLGRIYGTPTAAGTFEFELTATNAYGSSPKAFSITISAAGGGGGAFVFLA